MADGIYIGMNGAAARAAQLDAVADNLANAQTPGFKAATPAFEAFLPPSGGAQQAHVAAVAGGWDSRAGAVLTTNAPLDVMPKDGAFLLVQTQSGPALTRDGRIRVDADGGLRVAGFPLLGRSGHLLSTPPGARVEVDGAGNVLANGQVLDALSLAKVDGPISRIAPSILAPEAGAKVTPFDGGVQVGQLEASNANPLTSAVELISVQRHYETSLQAIQTYRRLDERANELGKVR